MKPKHKITLPTKTKISLRKTFKKTVKGGETYKSQTTVCRVTCNLIPAPVLPPHHGHDVEP